MRIQRLFALIPMALLMVGCAHRYHSDRKYTFLDSEVAYWRKSAVEAVGSPDQWAGVKGTRLTQRPIEVDESLLEHNLRHADRVEVIVRLPFGPNQQPSFVRVILDRGTGLVISMNEEFE